MSYLCQSHTFISIFNYLPFLFSFICFFFFVNWLTSCHLLYVPFHWMSSYYLLLSQWTEQICDVASSCKISKQFLFLFSFAIFFSLPLLIPRSTIHVCFQCIFHFRQVDVSHWELLSRKYWAGYIYSKRRAIKKK